MKYQKKLVEIEWCAQCPHYCWREWDNPYCEHPAKESEIADYPNTESYPLDCPLPNAPDKE